MKSSKIKHIILKKFFDKSLLRSQRNRVTSQKEIQSIGILTTEEIALKINLQKEIESVLNVRNSKMYYYRKENHKLDEFFYKHFSPKDLNWMGEAIEPSFQNFLDQPFDLLIGFYTTNNLYLQNATLKSKATFKAGFTNVNPSLYELEISEEIENVNGFCKELKKYLLILNKLKN